MKQVYKIDKDGFYLEPVLIGNDEVAPMDCVTVPPTEGMFKAQYKNGVWIEAMPQTEIDKLKNVPTVPVLSLGVLPALTSTRREYAEHRVI